jgi:deoxyribonuclease V
VNARNLHPWRVSYGEAIAIQNQLRDQLRLVPIRQPVRLVAGADVAYGRTAHRMYAALAVVSLPDLQLVETVEVAERATFPYIPGLLSFREIPPLLVAFRRLRSEPDVVMFDGQGLAHPRGFGLACHAGVLLDRPSIGCAKSRLIGEYGHVGRRRGAATELVYEGAIVGSVVRTRAAVKPVYVSPGHLCDINTAVELVLATTPRFRVPEPIRQAHQATTALRRRDEGRPGPAVRIYPRFVNQ